MNFIKAAIFLVMFAFSLNLMEESTEQTIAESISKYHLEKLNSFEAKLLELQDLEQQNIPESDLKNSFLACRIAFKYVEFLVVYTDNFKNKNYNSPNVLSAYESNLESDVIAAHGLQVVEDLIYNPDKESRENLKQELTLLIRLVQEETQSFQSKKLENPHLFNTIVIDALRVEVYRLEALGITGFDGVSSKNSLAEAHANLESLKKVLSFYKALFVQNNKKALYSYGIKTTQKAINYLKKNQDFDKFNRLEFMDRHLHPLSSYLYTLTKELNYEFPSNKNAINREARYLFDPNSLNQLYFAPLQSEHSLAIGKKLFEEKLLSSNHTRACSSCHIKEYAFTDDLVKNLSIDGETSLLRNTPSLINVAYQTKFFYDSRSKKLETQVINVIHNDLEMGGNLSLIIDSLKQKPEYAELFKKAYVGEIDANKLATSIAEYIGTFTSRNSKLDQYFAGDKAALNQSEINGFNLFAGKAKCATCHFFPLFNGLVPPHYTDTESEILGVPKDKKNPSIIDSDVGRYGNTKLEIHQFAFKTPALRNIELSAPY
ncbi:MAG: hypothetical protein KDC82_08695, partial [Bacteroidetes bacterium]|nr:hypothetical protein [Bacteroidota bacterium]